MLSFTRVNPPQSPYTSDIQTEKPDIRERKFQVEVRRVKVEKRKVEIEKDKSPENFRETLRG